MGSKKEHDRCFRGAWALLGALGSLAPFAAGLAETSAQDESPERLPEAWWTWERATGEWGGVRTTLRDAGISIEIGYAGEVFANLRGGRNTRDAAECRGNADLFVIVDTEKPRLWPEGRLFLYAQDGRGEGVTARHVGAAQNVSNLEADTYTQASEYRLEQRLFEERLRVKVGKQDANRDFVSPLFGRDFLHSSFGVIPTVPLPTFPDPGLGAAAYFEVESPWAFKAGIFDGDPRGGTSAFDTAFDGEEGAFAIAAVAVRFGRDAEGEPEGTYRVGTWHPTADAPEISGDPAPRIFSGNEGIYAAFDQLLFENGRNAGGGVGVFGQFGWAAPEKNAVSRHLGGGLSYQGLVPGRPDDVSGLGIASARLADASGRVETAIKIFPKARLRPWMSLQPDLQFVANPGSVERYALVTGLRVKVKF